MLMTLLRHLPGSEFDGTNDLLSRISVLALGFLWCQADEYNKAEMFFELLNPPEKNQNDASIAWSDKEWPLVFDTIAQVAVDSIPRAYQECERKKESLKRSESFKTDLDTCVDDT